MSAYSALCLGVAALLLWSGCASPAPAASAPVARGDLLTAVAVDGAQQVEPFATLPIDDQRGALVLGQLPWQEIGHRPAFKLGEQPWAVLSFDEERDSFPTILWAGVIPYQPQATGVMGVVSVGGEGSYAQLCAAFYSLSERAWALRGCVEPPYHMIEFAGFGFEPARVEVLADGTQLELPARYVMRFALDDCADCGVALGVYEYESDDEGRSWRLSRKPPTQLLQRAD